MRRLKKEPTRTSVYIHINSTYCATIYSLQDLKYVIKTHNVSKGEILKFKFHLGGYGKNNPTLTMEIQDFINSFKRKQSLSSVRGKAHKAIGFLREECNDLLSDLNKDIAKAKHSNNEVLKSGIASKKEEVNSILSRIHHQWSVIHNNYC